MMKKSFKLWSVLLLTLLAAMMLTGAELKTGTFTFGKNKKGYLFLPENFNPGKHNKFILFMHGRGSKAGSAGNFGEKEFETFRNLCSAKGYVVAVPPLVASWFNPQAEKDVDEMLDFLATELKMDLSRIHVMGCSMGGMAALVYAGKNAEKVITVTDIFGATELKNYSQGNYKESIKVAFGGYYDQKKIIYESRSPINYVGILKHLPLLIIHGATDTLVKPEHSQNLYNALTQAGSTQVKLIMVPKTWHSNSIVKGRENMIIDFMEAHK